MTQHIFNIIWNERKINLWILIELILVFCILWFCVDYTYFFVKRYFEPKGYDIEHVYNVNLYMTVNKAEEFEPEKVSEAFWTIVDRIEKYPEVESSCISIAAIPYSGSYSGNLCFIDTAVTTNIQIKSVTSGYFDVFKIKIESGSLPNWNDTPNNTVIISGDKDNTLFDRPVSQLKVMNLGGKTEYQELKIVGTASPVKRGDFESIKPVLYEQLSRDEERILKWGGAEISIRVKPQFEKDFAVRFSKNMQEQLSVSPYYLSSVISLSKQKDDYMKNWGYDSNFKSIFSVSSFLLINIFLAVVGTFWFRIQARRSEIGLRIALGSTHTKVKSLFIYETLILLILASIIATLICLNISATDLLKSIGVPSVNRDKDPIETSQYFANYGFTLLIIGGISVIAVWYPARKASNVQPAEALRDE